MAESKAIKIDWYRCPIDSTTLRNLTKRSDLKGFLYTMGQVVLIGGSGFLTYLFFVRSAWIAFAVTFWIHGIIRTMSASGFHEFSHGTVFKSKWLNTFFLRIWSLINWSNHHHYKMSHTYHHLYTLHPAGDGEVVLPRKLPLKLWVVLQIFTVRIDDIVRRYFKFIRVAFTGKYDDEWSKRIFGPDQALPFKRTVRWTRIVLLFHIAVLVISLLFGEWIIPIIFSLGGSVGTWLIFFVGGTMHAGLRDNVPDFRKCVRSIRLDPISGYLRWNMHYHIEHHMFAAVPCYNLGRLYRAVAADMPKRRSLIGAWREIKETERRQKTDPSYQFDTPVPEPSKVSHEQDPIGAAIGDIKPRDYTETVPIK